MGDLAGTTAVVLAGGLATRLHSVLDDCPKVLAPIRGRPFLAYLLDQLQSVRVRRVVLCTGHLGAAVAKTFGHCYGDVRLIYSQESSPLGTGGALRYALPHVASDPALVMNGDSFCRADLPAMWARHHTLGTEATLLLVSVANTQRYGRVRTDENGFVVAFEEKGGSEGSGWINSGIYLIGRRLIETIPAGSTVSLEREVFPKWIGQGLGACFSEGRFLDIGTPEAYATAEEFFAPAKEDRA